MAESDRRQSNPSELPDPEETAGGISQKKYLGVPVWAAAGILAALCAVMYLLMLMLR